MLALEVEFLTGVSVAASPLSREVAEWPPHPDRLFQALVAAWARLEPPDDEETAALEWLERLPYQDFDVLAPPAAVRKPLTVFVPPNDAATTKAEVGVSLKRVRDRLVVLPQERRNRQPRTFPAAVPQEGATVVFVWRRASGHELHRPALSRMLKEMTYLGHSHSPVRGRLLEPAEPVPGELHPTHYTALRVPHPGRLDQLASDFDARRRPSPSTVRVGLRRAGRGQPSRTLYTSGGLLALADAGGCRPPALEAFPLVAKRLRDALLKTADSDSLPISESLSGHDSQGRPASRPHLAILPLADVGWRHSQGRLMGIAIAWPSSDPDGSRPADLRVLAGFIRRGGGLHLGALGTWRLSADVDPSLATLRLDRLVGPARAWSTVLPMALDRHPKPRNGTSALDVARVALRNSGLPPETVDGATISLTASGRLAGAPFAPAVRRSLAADSPYRNRPLAHLTVEFPEDVAGPLLLGAGRHRGLGLLLPLHGAD